MNPFAEYRITSPYGPRPDPFTGQPAFHTGIDLVLGDKAPIKAFTAGTVVHAKEGVTGSGFGGFGNVVALKDNKGAIQFYAHLSSISVTVGQLVAKGQIVGKQGNTGHSAGSHLHYEVRSNGKAAGFGFGSDTEPTAYLQKFMSEDSPPAPAPSLPTHSTPILDEEDDQLKLLDWQWEMLTQQLHELFTKKLITDITWAEKAASKSLTVSELLFVNTTIINRTNK